MARAKDRPFVKSADTSTSVVNSRSEVDKMLRRYGATQISLVQDIENHRITVSFIVPDSTKKDAPKVPVKLPVSILTVYHALYEKPMRYVRWDQEAGKHIYEYNPGGYDRKKMDQAERVAWRNLALWIDAALSASSVGLQTITEAFFAHAIVSTEGARMIEVVEAFQSQLGSGVQRLLTSESES
jgi:hypothetical protein